MENLLSLENQLKNLQNKVFVFEKKKYSVIGIRYTPGRFIIYATYGVQGGYQKEQTFVKDSEQFQAFMDAIEILPENIDEKQEFKPDFEKITLKPKVTMDTQTTTALSTSVSNTEKVNEALYKMFEKLSDNPTEEDFKKADAMSKLANTMIGVSQTQINFMKLKNNL